MNSSTLSSLLITLGLILIISNAANAKAQSKISTLIEPICKKTFEDKERCMQVMRSNPKFLTAENHKELSENIIELAITKSIAAQKILKKFAEGKNSKALDQCANAHYNLVVSSFKVALVELEEDAQSANLDAKVAGDGADSCEAGILKERDAIPAVCALNKEIKFLSTLAFLASSNLS